MNIKDNSGNYSKLLRLKTFVRRRHVRSDIDFLGQYRTLHRPTICLSLPGQRQFRRGRGMSSVAHCYGTCGRPDEMTNIGLGFQTIFKFVTKEQKGGGRGGGGITLLTLHWASGSAYKPGNCWSEHWKLVRGTSSPWRNRFSKPDLRDWMTPTLVAPFVLVCFVTWLFLAMLLPSTFGLRRLCWFRPDLPNWLFLFSDF